MWITNVEAVKLVSVMYFSWFICFTMKFCIYFSEFISKSVTRKWLEIISMNLQYDSSHFYFYGDVATDHVPLICRLNNLNLSVNWMHFTLEQFIIIVYYFLMQFTGRLLRRARGGLILPYGPGSNDLLSLYGFACHICIMYIVILCNAYSSYF